MGISLMAKKATDKAKADPDEMVPRTIKMRQAYAEWFERFATHERVSLSALVDRALSVHAQQIGFEPPPERLP
jgi:hypothetical protein